MNQDQDQDQDLDAYYYNQYLNYCTGPQGMLLDQERMQTLIKQERKENVWKYFRWGFFALLITAKVAHGLLS